MKNQLLSKLFALVACLSCALGASAYSFVVNGIYYSILIDSDGYYSNDVMVTCKDFNTYNTYSGNVTIPSSVTYNGAVYSVVRIGYNAFKNCTELTSVTIPNSVTRIDDYAFPGCALRSVNFSNELTYLGAYAFQNCSSLQSVTIPNKITAIYTGTFQNCTSLQSVTLPNSINRMDAFAFDHCSALTSVTIPDSVTLIDYEAFYCCTSLNSLTLGNSVETINSSAFQGCSALTNVVFPNSVTRICGSSFKDCTALRSVTLGCSVKTVEYNVFAGCPNLRTINCWAATPPTIQPGTFDSDTYSNATLTVRSPYRNDYLYAENWSNFSRIYMKYYDFAVGGIYYFITGTNTVMVTNNGSLDCYSGSVDIPANVTYGGKTYQVTAICKEAFYNSEITSVTIPYSVTSIGAAAFVGCSSLTNINCWAATPPAIESDTFDSSTYSTATLTVPNPYRSNYLSTNYWRNFYVVGKYYDFVVNGIYYLITGNNTVMVTNNGSSGCYSGSVNIPANVTYGGTTYQVTAIADDAFAGYSITGVTIPNSVTSMGSNAFMNCRYLASVKLSESLTEITPDAFSGCWELTSVVIPNSVTNISSSAFKGSGLTSVVIGSSVYYISESAFYCSNLTRVTCLATTPPEIDEYHAFYTSAYTNATLFVPRGSKSAYQKAYDWKNFVNIAEVGMLGDVNFDGEIDVSDVTSMISMVLGSIPIDPAVADLDGDGLVDVLDVTALIRHILNGTLPALPTKTFTVNGIPFTMVAVDGGNFTMGFTDTDQQAQYIAKPAHQVRLSGYRIGQAEVTQLLWFAVMGANPSELTGDLNRPVENVSWEDCQTFISKLNEMTGETFRLPTEAEWEYAALGGSKSHGYTYAGSDNISNVAWYSGNAGNTTHTVATKTANELGLYDMSGNVWEWCSDWYGNYSADDQIDPTGPASGTHRIIRGGCWAISNQSCSVKFRSYESPSHKDNVIGLRLAM